MIDEDDEEGRIRSISAIRRNGWDRSHAKRAIGALGQLVAAAPRTPDNELARELVSWLAADPSSVVDLEVPAGLLDVPTHLAPAVHILLDEDLSMSTKLSRLRETYSDPTAALIAILDDMEIEDLTGYGIHSVAAAAVRGLAQLGTIRGMRHLFAYLDMDAEGLHEVVRREVWETESIVPIALELWSSADYYARTIMVEAIARQRRHDDRIMKLLEEWIDSDLDVPTGVLAAADYGDARLIPSVRSALERALSRDAYRVAGEIVDGLRALGAEPTEAERQQLADVRDQ